jgi:hypothetical protein
MSSRSGGEGSLCAASTAISRPNRSTRNPKQGRDVDGNGSRTIPPAQDVRRLREVMAALTRSALLDIASERVDVFAQSAPGEGSLCAASTAISRPNRSTRNPKQGRDVDGFAEMRVFLASTAQRAVARDGPRLTSVVKSDLFELRRLSASRNRPPVKAVSVRPAPRFQGQTDRLEILNRVETFLPRLLSVRSPATVRA